MKNDLRNNRDGEEYVMVFPTKLLFEIGYFQGILFDVEKYVGAILNNENHNFILRKIAEKDATYKQVIPYIILMQGNKIYRYRRGKKLAEKRLHGYYSIGLGGHISKYDQNLFESGYYEAIYRELGEETGLSIDYDPTALAVINDDTDEVGKVHFGIVHSAIIKDASVEVKRKMSINEGGFVSISDLRKNIDKYESWSKLCINGIEKLFE